MSKNINIPKLRFKEFSGDWEDKTINDVANIIGGGTPDTTVKEYWNGNIQWFTPTEIKSMYISNSKRTISELGLKKSSAKILPKGSLLLSTRATVGDVGIAVNECTTNQGFQSLIITKNNNNIFIYNWILNNKIEFLKKSSGSTFLEISKKEIEKIKIITPSKQEQEKIASFLTSVDTKIEQLTKKETLLKEYKKGVMQKIFNQEIRFVSDDGSEFGDWEKRKIGEIFKFKQGVQCGVENQFLQQSNGQIRFIRIVDVTSDEEPIRYIENPGSEHQIMEDDLFMVRYGAAGVVGYGYSGVLANNLFRFLPINSLKIKNKFYFFLFNYMKHKFEQLAGSSTMPALNFKSLNTLTIIQPSLKEQTKIANFLSSIDTKIEQTRKQLEQTKEFKKALLQKMFV